MNQELSSNQHSERREWESCGTNRHNYRKASLEVNPYRRVLEKPVFLMEGKITEKKVGKIVRNPHTGSHKKQNIDEITSYDPSSKLKLMNNFSNDIMNKIKYSQMTYQSDTANFFSHAVVSYEEKENVGKKQESVSDKYKSKYADVIEGFQLKKQKINEEINMLKNKQNIVLGVVNQNCYEIEVHLDTPKFGSFRDKSELSAKKCNKINRSLQWREFMSNMKQQIKLQGKLRQLKHQIKQADAAKINTILQINHKIKQDLITLNAQQFDPFFIKKENVDYKKLADQISKNYMQADTHWNQKMKKSYDQPTLVGIFSSLQSQKEKGVISLKGFVRELGILFHNEIYLRNRDLYRIYKRIQPFTKQKFIAEFCKPNKC